MQKVIFFYNKVPQLFVVMATIAIVVFLSSCSKGQVDVKEQVHSSVNKIQESINQASSETSANSNPYDYVKNNEDFEAIIALGVAALPELKQLLDNSEQDGLIEYIYAIALEKISKVDMRKKTEWSTGKEFLKTYTAYLKEIPNKVKNIANEPISDTEKVDQLKELGTPAIPYIFDVINNGHQELSPAIHYLTGNKSKIGMRKWSVENVDQLNLLTKFVEK
ncbi:hypothetical protein Back11_34020 [Paenibacillus baekrokdamisoli]|uniref:Uncharacterized protein n=1 Tax=Paenibacillus baekrokdamisoli TaxID=1712516 RepID=A0A3G9IT61_9BACL|nr:hypothetical protein [Paenibacillus baekrokdamisoli]MBB3071007.1 hypothetical protein [Paenibacillus baekrokdamisoli]BBH22057.1 hypothetical protein Back11_34020 [Paenibacillus baekrokdamisoli]